MVNLWDFIAIAVAGDCSKVKGFARDLGRPDSGCLCSNYRIAHNAQNGMDVRLGESLQLSSGWTSSMPRQRTQYSRRTYAITDDFPQRLVWFKYASGLPWAEIARRLGISPMTIRRWWKAGVRPNYRHLNALLSLADDLGLGHLFRE